MTLSGSLDLKKFDKKDRSCDQNAENDRAITTIRTTGVFLFCGIYIAPDSYRRRGWYSLQRLDRQHRLHRCTVTTGCESAPQFEQKSSAS